MAGRRWFWYDLETTGTHPALDRIAEVAWQITDDELAAREPSQQVLVAPLVDELPVPDACLISGLVPQQRSAHGISEPELADRLTAALGSPSTLIVGYNNRRFDDLFVRHLLWRNLRDPYQHEWTQGNRRWDLLDVLRLAYALRPEGLNWPLHPDGRPSLRLEDMSRANGIEHDQAHTALSDVRATITLAQRLRAAQPRLFAHALKLTERSRCEALLERARNTPILHASPRYPLALGGIAPVLSLGPIAGARHRYLLYDLRTDPHALQGLSVADLRERLYTERAALPEDELRPPIKSVHAGHAPMLAPLEVADRALLARWQIDVERIERHAERLRNAPELIASLHAAIGQSPTRDATLDPELALYAGFPSDADRRRLEQLHVTAPEQWPARLGELADARLVRLGWRFLARHHADVLSHSQFAEWRDSVAERLRHGVQGHSLTLSAYLQRLAELKASSKNDPKTLALLAELERWGFALAQRFGVDPAQCF